MRAYVAALTVAACTASAADTTVYRCDGQDSRVVFQQAPCAAGGVAIVVPPVNLVEGSPAGDASLRAEAQRNAAVRDAIAARRVLPGMNEAEVRQALGTPGSAQLVVRDDATLARWVYRYRDGARRVVRLQDGVVVSSEVQQRLPVAQQPLHRTKRHPALR